MARPLLPDHERRSEVLQMRLTKDERALMDEAADRLGVSVTDLIRDAALAKAKRAVASSPISRGTKASTT